MRSPVAALALIAIIAIGGGSARAEDLAARATELAEFAIGARLAADDRRRVAELVDAGDGDPAARAELGRALAGVRALGTEAARADARRAIVTRLYWEKSDPLGRLIVERAGVVAADPKTGVVVRRADIAGLCASAMIAAGQGFDRDDCLGRLEIDVRDLPTIDKARQDVIAAGERRAALLAQYWKVVPLERRAALLEQARRMARSTDPLRVARALETSAVSASLAERLERFGDATARGLETGAAASAIGREWRGF